MADADVRPVELLSFFAEALSSSSEDDDEEDEEEEEDEELSLPLSLLLLSLLLSGLSASCLLLSSCFFSVLLLGGVSKGLDMSLLLSTGWTSSLLLPAPGSFCLTKYLSSPGLSWSVPRFSCSLSGWRPEWTGDVETWDRGPSVLLSLLCR